MDLVFASLLYPSTGKRAIYEMKPFSSTLNTTRQMSTRKIFPCLATVVTQTMQRSEASEFDLENKKHGLLRAIQDTQRGLVTTMDQRSSIEEALVSVEGYDAGAPVDLMKLDGTWRLQYTSAPDVLILLESAARLPIFQVGQIFQKFECQDKADGGVVRNVVRWSIPTLLEITLQNININEELQALIAPAILPRSFLSLQILQFFRSFRAQFPVQNPERQSVGGLYYLSYLDRDMLLGRSVGGGGVFVFTKAQPLEL